MWNNGSRANIGAFAEKKSETADVIGAVIQVHTNNKVIHKDNLFLRHNILFWMGDKMSIDKLIQF